MNPSKLLTVILLITVSVTALSSTIPGDIPLSFPFFQSSQSTGIPDELMVGYGDWCVAAEGLHMGIDFFAANADDQVLNPFDVTMYSIGAYYVPDDDYNGCIIGIGPEGSDYGWAIEHLGPYPYIKADADDWCSDHTRGKVLALRSPIDTCCVYGSGVPRHTHVQWSHWVFDQFHPGGYIMTNPWASLENPFSYFIAGVLKNYEQVRFKAVWPEIFFLNKETNTGVFFLPGGIESYIDYVNTVGSEYVDQFQNIVYSALDIVVSPFSAMNDYPDNNGCGVYSVGYEIYRQNPITIEWDSTESAVGNWGYRKLFQAEGQIEEATIWVDIYEALFHDISLFENAYIVTNSGAKDPSNWDHGWDNVWTVASINNWATGICQGAWDTFLAKPEIVGNPTQNSEAFFPDGRYAVKVTAVSHGSRDTANNYLPRDDLSLPRPQIEGVVVDNFLPHIVRVAAYAWNPDADTCHKIYAGYWEDIDPVRQLREESEYLESLRTQLHTLQSETGSNSSPAFCAVDLTEPSSHSLIDQNNRPESIRPSEDHLEIVSAFKPGYCLDEGIGQDPVEFLMDEITRIENQQVFDADTTRAFDDRVYGYLPMTGLTLILQVFYSEPTMADVYDKVYFRSYIGPDTSYFAYPFRRLGRNFELPLDATAYSETEFDSVLFDSSNVVYYIYKSSLPQYYMGNILLYFGSTDLQDDEGPRDLAGNAMDSDPSTTANTRNGYAPFSNDGYEAGQDLHYSWDPPNWLRYSNIVYGTVGIEQDLVAKVDLDAIGLGDALLIGDCDYWCGFWMYRDEPDEYGFNIYVVKPDGSYINHSFETPFPAFEEGSEQFWSGYDHTLSPDSRYLWMLGYTWDWPNAWSTVYAYCVDSETGARIDGYELCEGWLFLGGYHNERHLDHSEKFPTFGSWGVVLDIDSTTAEALVYYIYYPEYCNQFVFVEDTIPLSPPGGSDNNLFGDIYCNSNIRSDTEEVIEILSNPVRETLGVRLVGEYGDNFELLLYDIAGRQILSESGILRDDESLLNIGVQNLPSGVYLLRITAGTAEVRKTVSIIH